MKLNVLIVIFATIASINSQLIAQTPKQPVSVIFDTDIGPDYDDVGAITLLHALADSGECKILATMASNRYSRIAAVLDVFNTYFTRPAIPIGVVGKNGAIMECGQKWDSVITARYPHDIINNEQAEDATKLYRKILSQQPDKSVTIITVGFLTNMANLIESKADQYSKLNGIDLIRKKVKQLVSMAGAFPKGREYNVHVHAAASKIVAEKFPAPIIFSGVEIGMRLFTGIPLINSEIKNSPVKDVFSISIAMSNGDRNGRMSWDQTAVLIAVRGYEKYFNLEQGRMTVNPDGSNGWDFNGKGHFFVTGKMEDNKLEDLINHLMMHQPVKR
jgi:pyrimidine-specific ribonucleoside hydrolase